MENKEKEVLLKVRGAKTYFPIKKGLMKVIPERKKDMLEVNLKAVQMGYDY